MIRNHFILRPTHIVARVRNKHYILVHVTTNAYYVHEKQLQSERAFYTVRKASKFKRSWTRFALFYFPRT